LAGAPVGGELREVQSGRIRLNVGDRLKNVVSLEPGIALWGASEHGLGLGQYASGSQCD
jgi:hypothetical protein